MNHDPETIMDPEHFQFQSRQPQCYFTTNIHSAVKDIDNVEVLGEPLTLIANLSLPFSIPCASQLFPRRLYKEHSILKLGS